MAVERIKVEPGRAKAVLQALRAAGPGAKLSPDALIAQYRIYVTEVLDLVEEEPTGALLALVSRDGIVDHWSKLSEVQRQEVNAVDDLLVAKWERIRDAVPPGRLQDRSRWWWFLHEGPHVREQDQGVA